jgi:CBS domain-containing protein
MSVMTDNRARHLPVMRDEQLLGMISIGDVVKFCIEEIETEAATLRQYIPTA